jgi:FtsP/CotA-like multicopper oxidase with cupredoxin domain
MSSIHIPVVDRRTVLLAGVGAAAGLLPRSGHADAPRAAYNLTAAIARSPILGTSRPWTEVWSYNGRIPGPEIRVRQGEPVRFVVRNDLSEETTVHWHGIRLPNNMDGVPGLTQRPIAPGETFTYEFTPPDAGTFWYHSHSNSLQQLGRGLAGPLIVEEGERYPVDREFVWMFSDWRLTADAQIASGFGNAMEAAMSGRVGNTVTVNGAISSGEQVQAGERIRLRLINGALARIMALRFEGHRPVVIAVDGQPCEPHQPADDRLLLGPAMRIDVVLDLLGEPGRRYAVRDDFYEDLAYTVTHLNYSANAALRTARDHNYVPLPGNPLPEPDLTGVEPHRIVLQGGMMGGGMMHDMGGMSGMAHDASWSINGHSMTGDGQGGMPPLLTLPQGRSIVLKMQNQTAWWHPMHLHGYSFKLLRRNGAPVPYRQWGDTVLLAPNDNVNVAFVADHPGKWMLHCHITDHQVSGMMSVLDVR